VLVRHYSIVHRNWSQWGWTDWTFSNNKTSKEFLPTLCPFSIFVQLSKIRFFKPWCAPANPAALFLCSTARIRQDFSAASFYRCKLLCRIDECILFPSFNVPPNSLTVTNRCMVALGVIHTSKIIDQIWPLH